MKDLHTVTKEDIVTLLGFSSPAGVLSMYVGIPATERHDTSRLLSAVRSGCTELLRLHGGNKNAASLADTAQKEIAGLPLETRRRSLVYFRSLDPDWVFWRSLQPCFHDVFAIAPSPQVAPLVSLLDETPKVGVAVTSQDRTRVFSWNEGVIEEHAEITADGDTPLQPETPGHGFPPNRTEDRARRGLHRMAGRIAQAADSLRWQKLVFAGPGTVTSAVADQLPDTWRRQMIQPIERNMINAPVAEINDLVGKQVHDWRRQQELSEITELIDDARSGGRGATGVAACLDHLSTGRVEKLYVCADLELSGFSDSQGRLHATLPPDAGGNTVHPEPRLVERMIVQAIESGAAVIPVEGDSARKLTLLGGVATRLRWRDAPPSPEEQAG